MSLLSNFFLLILVIWIPCYSSYLHLLWNTRVILQKALLENQHFIAIPSICFRGPWLNRLCFLYPNIHQLTNIILTLRSLSHQAHLPIHTLHNGGILQFSVRWLHYNRPEGKRVNPTSVHCTIPRHIVTLSRS